MAGWPRLVWLILARGVAQDPTCWDGDFTEALCCDKTFGPRGHEGCWDGIHTFERCCGVQEDCWDSDFDHEKCCDLVKGHSGDEACWSGAQTFEYCCSGDRTPLVTGDQPLEELPSFGEGCWDAKRSLTFSRCCSIPEMKESCFEGRLSYERCCLGLSPIRRYFMDLPREHELVRCLREGLEGPIKANGNVSLEECHGKYIHVSGVKFRSEVDVMDDFWWQRPQDQARGRNDVTPEWLHHAGSLCVPTTCSNVAVAGWFASMVDMVQHHRPSYRMLNASHVRVSPLNARLRPYPTFNGSWLMWRPQTDALLRKQQNLHENYFEFVLYEHINWRQLRLGAETQMVLLALALPVVLASLLRSLGVEAAEPLALQSNLKKLGSPRQRCFDLCRIVTTVFAVAKHAKDHYLWPVHNDERSIFGFMMSSVEAFPTPQFVVMLMVYMALRRLDTHPPAVRGPVSWFCRIISYALGRWALIMSIVGIWLYIYLAIEVPLPNIGKNRFLYQCFLRNRLQCAHGKHLIPTIFLVHEATHAYPSMCHNIGIFEMCFQVDVVLMAMLLLLPRRLSALLSAMAYIPLACCGTLEAGEPFLRTVDYLPVGLLTIAIANGLPRASTLSQCHWSVRLILWSLALHSYGLFGFMMIESAETESQVGQLAVQLGVAPWVLRTLPVLLGTVVVLRLLDAQTSSPGPGWSMLSALGRLCGQINISHLFVLQIHLGFATGNANGELVRLPASPSLFLWLWAFLFLCSAGIATILFLFVGAPVQALLGRSGDTARRRSDHANGTTNGHVVNGHRR